MGYSGTHWPEGLNDEEALQRLQTLCLGACDGIQVWIGVEKGPR